MGLVAFSHAKLVDPSIKLAKRERAAARTVQLGAERKKARRLDSESELTEQEDSEDEE